MLLKVLIAFFTVGMSGNLHAGRIAGLESIVNPDLVCESQSMKIAIRLEDHKIWQADPGMEEGMPIFTSVWRPLACRGCYLIQGSAWGLDVVLQVMTSEEINDGNSNKTIFTFSMISEAGAVFFGPNDWNRCEYSSGNMKKL